MPDHHNAISNLNHRFIELLDQRNYAEVAKLFAHGSLSISRPLDPNPASGEGEAGVLAMLTGMLPPPSPDAFARHIPSNLIVEIDDGGTTAQARMYTAAHLFVPNKSPHFLGVGRHMDKLVLRDGLWTFVEKTIIGDAQFALPKA